MSVRVRAFLAAIGVAAGLSLAMVSALVPGLAWLLWPGIVVAGAGAVLLGLALRDIVGQIERNQVTFEASLRAQVDEKREQKR